MFQLKTQQRRHISAAALALCLGLAVGCTTTRERAPAEPPTRFDHIENPSMREGTVTLHSDVVDIQVMDNFLLFDTTDQIVLWPVGGGPQYCDKRCQTRVEDGRLVGPESSAKED